MAFNRGCAETAGLYSFGCQQQTPTPLPDIPATAVLFGFGPDGLFPEGSGGDVGSALDAINQYLACFPQNICSAAEEGDIIQYTGSAFELISLDDLIGSFIEDLLPQPGTFIFNDGGNVGPANFCDEVAECIESAIGTDGNVLTNDGGNLISTPFEDILQDALEGLLDPGEVLVNDGGNITGADLCGEVFDCLSSNLGSGQIPLGGAPGGVAVLCDEVEACLDNLLGNGEVLVGGPAGSTPTDLCAAVEACFTALYNTGNGDVLYDSGSGLAPTDLCTLVTDCITGGGVLTGAGTYLGTDSAGNVGEIDFCQAVADCLAAAATPSGNGTYYGVDDSGNLGFYDLCAAVADCVAALPVNGDPGDMQVVNAAGQEEYRTFIEYMNEFYPQTACDTYLYYDLNAGVWTFRTGPEPLPPNPAVDLVPILPPANAKGSWEFDKETGCSDLVCSPRQKDITINVPGDFPTLQDAANWLRAKTVENVVINLTAADPGVNFDGTNGRIIVLGNNNTVAGVIHTTSTVQLTMNNIIVTGSGGDGLFVSNNAAFSGDGLTIDSNTANGINASNGGHVTLTNLASVSSNGINGVAVNDNASVLITGATGILNNGSNGIAMSKNATLSHLGNVLLQTNAQDGAIVSDNSALKVTGDITALSNGLSGVSLSQNSSLSFNTSNLSSNLSNGLISSASDVKFFTAFISETNGIDGISLLNGSTLSTDGGALASNGNGGSGVNLLKGSNAALVNVGAAGNTTHGVSINENSSLTAVGQVDTISNGQMGVNITRSSSFMSYSGVSNHSANGNVGVYALDNSHAYVVSAVADANGGSGFYSQDRSHINATNSTATNNAAGFGYTAILLSDVSRGGSTTGGNALGPNNIPLNVTSVDGSFMI